jgi:L-ascorbate metabolism protein UlaG (beta-lactamase superfamily)
VESRFTRVIPIIAAREFLEQNNVEKDGRCLSDRWAEKPVSFHSRRGIMKMSRLPGIILSFALASAVVAGGSARAQGGAAGAGKTEILWLGQASFRIKSPGGKVIVVDAWLTNGPKAPAAYKDLAALGKVDLLLVTHGHVDHLGDAPAIAKLNNTVLYGPADMITPLVTLGILPANLTHRFNKSGHVTPLPGIKVTAVKAEHSSLIVWSNPATGKNESHPAGEAMGYIIQMENGFKIWHMGDTGLFPDMQFISEHYKPDLVLIPIGGNFTMDHDDAAFAARTWIKPKNIVPIHYGA